MPQTTVRLSVKYVLTGLPDGIIHLAIRILNYPSLSFHVGAFPQGAASLDGRYMMRKLDYWVAGTNENAQYYSPGSNGEAADTYSSSMNYQDGSYIKVRNISLGYNFTSKQLKNVGLNNLKVYVQAMNPFTIYKACDWLDTDLLNYDNNTKTFGSATTLKSFVIGVNIGF